MRDGFGREITYLRLSITDLCDLRCIYCMPPEGVDKREHGELLSFEEIVDAARVAVSLGVRKIRVSGGEPLVRRGVVSLCELLSGLGTELAMTTNGTHLAAMAGDLARAGLHRVNISLDTMREDRYSRITRGGKLADVLRGIDAAEAAGLTPIKLNTVLMRGINDDEIEDIAALTMRRSIDVRFIELMPIGPVRDRVSTAGIGGPEVLSRLGEVDELGASGVAMMYKMKGAIGRVGLIDPVSGCFCAECTRLRLTADGRLKPCLHSRDEISIKGLSGRELEEAFIRAVGAKPKDHGGLSGGRVSESARGMDRIGG